MCIIGFRWNLEESKRYLVICKKKSNAIYTKKLTLNSCNIILDPSISQTEQLIV